MQDGFVDLRTGHHSDVVHDSFWPSFTDVMMVVVMIFIMVSLVLVVKNWDLVAELRATIQAEREAQEFVHTTAESNKTLSEQLADTQFQLSQLRMQMMRVEEESQSKSLQIEERDKQLQASRDEVKTLARQIEEASRRQEEMAAQLASLQEQSDARLKQFETAQQERNTFEEQLASKSAELEILQLANVESESLADELQESYDELQVKYNKLIKPARSAKGKYVVEVRYEKRGKYYHIRYKDPGDESYTAVTRKELETHLAGMKDKHPRKLYIKIIIPSDSGLSYNEAWRFTTEILAEYDYYHQD